MILIAGDRFFVCPHAEKLLNGERHGETRLSLNGLLEGFRWIGISPPMFHKHQPVKAMFVCEACYASHPDPEGWRVKWLQQGAVEFFPQEQGASA